jgi:hypothetical protein
MLPALGDTYPLRRMHACDMMNGHAIVIGYDMKYFCRPYRRGDGRTHTRHAVCTDAYGGPKALSRRSLWWDALASLVVVGRSRVAHCVCTLAQLAYEND